jgi:hypothetical protein
MRWTIFPALVMRARWAAALPLLALTLAVVLAVGIGERTASARLQSDPESCPQPCWRGFRPGETAQAEALAMIEAVKMADMETVAAASPGDSSWRQVVEWETRSTPVYEVHMRFTHDLLDRIDLYPRETVRLADVFSVMGAPSHVVCQLGFRYFSTQLYFYDGAVEVWAVAPPGGRESPWQIGPDMLVSRIAYSRGIIDVVGVAEPIGAMPWEGFVRANEKGYCR